MIVALQAWDLGSTAGRGSWATTFSSSKTTDARLLVFARCLQIDLAVSELVNCLNLVHPCSMYVSWNPCIGATAL